MSRKFYAVVAFFVVALAQTSFAAWDGSAKVPKVTEKDGQKIYEITSPAELIGFLDSVVVTTTDSRYVRAYLKNDIVFGADTTKLCEKKWTRNPDQIQYSGEFDGRGHSIYGLNANRALFAYLSANSVSVHDVNVVRSSFGDNSGAFTAAIADAIHSGGIWNVNVVETDVRSKGGNAGGIVAVMTSSLSDYGYFTYILNSNVIGGSVGGGYDVGGIVGDGSGKIIGCTNSARVYFTDVDSKELSPNAMIHIGGIVGNLSAESGYAIADCINRGNVEYESLYMVSYVGGIAGGVGGNIQNVQNYGNVSSKVVFSPDTAGLYRTIDWTARSCVGGVIGVHTSPKRNSGDSRDWLNAGKVDAVIDNKFEKGELVVGGVVGSSNNVSISNALNRGAVTARGAGRFMETYVGGVCGKTEISSYSKGHSKLKNRGDVYGAGTFRTYAGGLAGYTSRTMYDGPGISLSFNYGNVTGVVADTSSESEVLDVGGIVGYNSGSTIGDVYNRGKVLAKGKPALAGSYVGGIVGQQRYNWIFIANSFSAAPSLAGDTVGGLIGFANDGDKSRNAYFDKTLADVDPIGRIYYNPHDDSEFFRTTAELQSDELLALLNTEGGKVADRKLWVRRGGYPVLTFDSLYKNDSIFFDRQNYAVPSSEAVGDTVVFTISTADEFVTFLELNGSLTYELLKVKLANDIVMGSDSLHLSMRKLSVDTSGRGSKMIFDGQNHTIYGLNMTRALFHTLQLESVVENLTIANSRFENDYGMSAAGIAISLEKDCLIRNVKIRNSLVRGGDIAGGIVASSYGTMLDVANENTPVYASDKTGGIVGENYGYVVGAVNSGKVSGRLAGGIVGYSYSNEGIVKDASNTGTVLGLGADSVAAGGIVGYSIRLQVMDALNTGLVEASSAAKVYAGGIVGKIESPATMSKLGNWGRVHILDGKVAYAGGLVGWYEGLPVLGIDDPTPGANFMESFNYGPVHIKTVKDSSYAGGIVGYGKLGIFHGDYNRGIVKNEGPSSKKWTGGMIATAEDSRLYGSYSYTDTLTGDGVGTLAYEWLGYTSVERYYYGKDLVKAPAVVNISDDPSSVYKTVEAKTFDELKAGSVDLKGGDAWIMESCLPRMKHDTTSTCEANVVKDFFDSSFVDQIVFKENVILADSTDQGSGSGEGPVTAPKGTVMAKVVVPLDVQVKVRNIAVSGLSENRPVLVMDLQGRLVKSVRAHRPSVNIALPRAGRYIVRSGLQTKIVTVR